VKTFSKLSIVLVGIMILTLSINSYAQGNGNRGNGGSNSQIITMINDMPTEALTNDEISSLMLMREEEKLARDVYLELFDRWNVQIFSNIANSEQQHTDMVALLLQKYDLADPFVEQRGVFANEELAELYTLLIEQGKESLLAGLKVGATIEDLDIYDLQQALVYIDNQDIRLVYQNLLKGSRNHMRSFYRQIALQSSSYQAQYITSDELEEIIDSEMERGIVDENGDPITVVPQRSRGKSGRGSGESSNFFGNTGEIAGINITNYPNPANPATTISYTIDQPAYVSLSIYNARGQVVRHFDFGYRSPGEYSYQWDSSNENGINVPSGIYFCRIQAGELAATRRLLLIQ
jgi:hypothetical protein